MSTTINPPEITEAPWAKPIVAAPNGAGSWLIPERRRSTAWRAVIIAVGFLALVALILFMVGTSNPSLTQPAAQSAGAFQPSGPNGHIVNVSLTAVETNQTLVPATSGQAPVIFNAWTFNGTAPGPVIRVHVGDTIHFTLRNASSIGMQHSIDFHAAMTPWANLPSPGSALTGNYQPVNPGQSKTFAWTAMFPGVFMYHCGVPPVVQHIANGMYGAIVVEPNNLPKEREYVLVNGEFYPGANPVNGAYLGDYNGMKAADPKYVVWNGVADQYKRSPLLVRPNEKFRLWVVNAGPTLTSAFHVIGTMFNAYADGNPANVLYGDQTYNIPPGGAAMFELQIPEPGLYPFLTHAFAYTDRGAVGLIRVDPSAPAGPSSYPTMGDPFSAGVKPFAPPAAVAAIVGANPGVPSKPSAASSASTMPMTSPMPMAPVPQTSATGQPAACSPSGNVLKVVASSTAFDLGCLAAPANTAFTIVMTNRDPGVPHNVAIYTDAGAANNLFRGDVVSGPASVTYRVPPLKAGTYYFRCDIHPQMSGAFVVK